MVLGLVLAVGIGASLGLLGGGGSILTLPILMHVLGMEAKPAIATSLLVVGVTSAAALVPHARAGRVNVRVGLAFATSSMAGAFAGGHLARLVPSDVLLVSFALLMLVTGVAMLRGRSASVAQLRSRPRARIFLVGAGVGLLTGLLGAGGGFVIVPALALLCGLSAQEAIGTSLLVVALNSFAGFAGTIGHVTVAFEIAALVTVAAVIGSIGGALAAGRVREAALRHAFAWLVLMTGAFMLWRSAPTAAALAAAGAAIAGLVQLCRQAAAARRLRADEQRTQAVGGRLLRAGDLS